MTTTVYAPPAPLGFVDKLLLLVAMGVAIALFLSVGWLAIAPDDPRGAVSTVTHAQPVLMIIQAAALAAVTAAIATIMIGAKLPDAGAFAAALGFALVTLRGDTAAYLLMHVANGELGRERSLALELAVESVIWFLAIVVALVVSGLVARWCFSAGAESAESTEPAILRNMAVSELPFFSRIVEAKPTAGDAPINTLAGLRFTGATAIVAVLVYALFSAGSAPRTIQHGQTYFATFAAFYFGVWAARSWFPIRTPLWALLAVPAVSVIGYVWTIVIGGSVGSAYLANIPPSRFMRTLPMAFIGVGVLGALAACWTTSDPAPARKEARKPAKRRTRR